MGSFSPNPAWLPNFSHTETSPILRLGESAGRTVHLLRTPATLPNWIADRAGPSHPFVSSCCTSCVQESRDLSLTTIARHQEAHRVFEQRFLLSLLSSHICLDPIQEALTNCKWWVPSNPFFPPHPPVPSPLLSFILKANFKQEVKLQLDLRHTVPHSTPLVWFLFSFFSFSSEQGGGMNTFEWMLQGI